MDMIKRLILLLFCVLCVGCTTHYRVHDPTTGKNYYTTKIVRKSSGAVDLTDACSGDRVILQSSEVSQITAQQYKNAVRGIE